MKMESKQSHKWTGGLRYFVLCGPQKPSEIYRMQQNGNIELMMRSGWIASVTNQTVGLHEIPEGAAQFIWERLLPRS